MATRKKASRPKVLTPRQKKFVEAYLQTSNASKAAVAAGYSEKGADVAGARLLGNAGVSAELERRRKDLDARLELTTERVLQEVARLSYSDTRKLYRDDGTLKKPKEWDDDTAAAVASVEVEELSEGSGKERHQIGYTTKLKLHSKVATLDLAMRYLGLLKKDREQLGNAIGKAIIIPAKGSVAK